MNILRPLEGFRGANPRFSLADLVVYSLILLFGMLQFAYYERVPDFVNDTMYTDLAKAILEKGSYEFDYSPETTLPPGLPLILALVAKWAGFGPVAFFHVMAVSATLGSIAAYELLRRTEGRMVGAVICLLLGSSTAVFRWSTQIVFAELPFFLFSMLVLLLVLKIDRTVPGMARIGWTLLLSCAIVLTVLIRSVGVTLLIAMCTWIAASFFVDPALGRRRVRWALIPLALGLCTQLAWTQWAQHRRTFEWQLGGWPHSYVDQLKVKSGNHPELGTVQLSDIPGRIGHNAVLSSAELGRVLTGLWISGLWFSPAVISVLVLIVIGLGTSLRTGGQLHDWYFLWNEITFLAWPWDPEQRFLYPILPLACLYLWRGAKTLKNYSARRPERLAQCLVTCGAFLTLSSLVFTLWIFRSAPFASARMDHAQAVGSILFWIIVTAFGLRAVKAPSPPNFGGSGVLVSSNRLDGWKAPTSLRNAAMVALAVLIGLHAQQQVHIGRENTTFDITKQPYYPEIEAAQWIGAHEPSDRVVMARKEDLVVHYSGHRAVWFPPISTADVLMDGIQRLHVTLVVVAHHWKYFQPDEDACFSSLLQAYGERFRLVHRGPEVEVYEVEDEGTSNPRPHNGPQGAPSPHIPNQA
jgi:hypothetical protein